MMEKEIVLNNIPVMIANIAKVSKGGRITIPQFVRENMGIDEDSRAVIYFNKDEKLLVIKVFD